VIFLVLKEKFILFERFVKMHHNGFVYRLLRLAQRAAGSSDDL
jgi:hypothetical protein